MEASVEVIVEAEAEVVTEDVGVEVIKISSRTNTKNKTFNKESINGEVIKEAINNNSHNNISNHQ